MPLLWLSLAFLLGILLAGWSHASLPWGWAALGLGIALMLAGWLLRRVTALAVILRRNPVLRVAPLALGIALLAGFARYALAQTSFTPQNIAFYNDSGVVEITGWVVRAAQPESPSNRITLQAESLSLPGQVPQTVRGKVLVSLPSGTSLLYGTRLRLNGELHAPEDSGTFSYREYLAQLGIYAVMAYPRLSILPGWGGSPLLRGLDALRRGAYALLQRFYPAPESALISGILLGWDDSLSADLQNAFRATGTSHIIAISGFNMAVLAGVFFSLFRRMFSEWGALLAALIAMALYTLLVGAEAPVTRAALMSALALTAHAIRRSTGGLNALLFATAGMTLFNPFLPWDVGFQLSFCATLGLLLYASRLDGWARRIAARFLPERFAPAVAGALGEYILFTLAAQAATLPVILSHFGRLALSALLANPLILPAQAPLLLFSEASLVLGAMYQPLGHLLALPAWALASYTLGVVAWMARLPLGAWAVPAPPLWVVILFYLWLSATALRAMGLPRLDTSLRPAWLLLGLFGIAAVLWRQVLAGGDGKLHVWVSVQQDSVLTMVQTPGGETLLINGLGQARESQAFLGKVLPPFNPPLAWWILASPSAAEVQGGLGALARFAVRQAALCGGLPSGRTTRTLEERLAAAGTPWQEWTDGAMLRGGNFSLQARMPNAETCLLILQEGQLKLILAGNASPQELPDLSDFMNGVIVVNSDSAGEMWRQAGFSVLSVPQGGFLHLASDGNTLRIERSP